MNRVIVTVCSVVLVLGVLISGARAAVPVDNRLKVSIEVSSLTAGRIYAFNFRLYDAATGGNELFAEIKSYKVPTSKTITHLLGSVNMVQPLRAEDFLQQVWVDVSTKKMVFPRIKLGPVPLAIGSQNADLLDGLDSTVFALVGHAHNGAGSGFDADTLDGQHGLFYRDAGNLNAGALGTDRYSAYADLESEGYLGNATGNIALNNGVLQPTLYAQRALSADTATTANSANTLSAAAQSVLDTRYGLAPPSQGLTGFMSTATVDSAGGVGEYASITIGADGLPIIAYFDRSNDDLKVLHCGNSACSSGNTTSTVDSAGQVGMYGSITIGADGLPVISYLDFSVDHSLKVLHCGNADCSSGNTATTVDSTAGVGHYTSITIGVDGLPVISYLDYGNTDLKVLHCGNADCSSGNTATTVDNTGELSYFTSITIGADGLPVISYLDGYPHPEPDLDIGNVDLKVLHCGDAACSSGNTATTVDSAGQVGMYGSITIGADSLPVISYHDFTNADLKVLHCGNAACSSGNTATTVDSTGYVGFHTSITIGADGLPLISYLDGLNFDLKLLHCGNAACSSGNTTSTVDSSGDVGEYTSITIGADGLPVISYYDFTNAVLKVAHVFFKPLGRR